MAELTDNQNGKTGQDIDTVERPREEGGDSVAFGNSRVSHLTESGDSAFPILFGMFPALNGVCPLKHHSSHVHLSFPFPWISHPQPVSALNISNSGAVFWQ